MNKPIYKIHGRARRQLKKELGDLKRYVKNFWYYHQLDKDMYFFYGCEESTLISDEQAQKMVDKAKKQIEKIENRLSVLYSEFC